MEGISNVNSSASFGINLMQLPHNSFNKNMEYLKIVGTKRAIIAIEDYYYYIANRDYILYMDSYIDYLLNRMNSYQSLLIFESLIKYWKYNNILESVKLNKNQEIILMEKMNSICYLYDDKEFRSLIYSIFKDMASMTDKTAMKYLLGLSFKTEESRIFIYFDINQAISKEDERPATNSIIAVLSVVHAEANEYKIKPT